MSSKFITLVDDAGREWRVHDYSIWAGVTYRNTLGFGQYRGFEPVDGGARRSLMMLEADRQRGLSREVLLDQLAKAPLYRRDDPAVCESRGWTVERQDTASA